MMREGSTLFQCFYTEGYPTEYVCLGVNKLELFYLSIYFKFYTNV